MFLDVVELRDFYDDHLGLLVRRMVRRRVRELWPNLRGQSLLGLGYAVPYLRPYRGEAERVIAAMPAQQGVLHLEDASIDRLLMVHALENTEQRAAMMTEAWRVLSGNGRLMVVVPNRRGLWARFDHTPFGHGQPYTVSQVSRVLRQSRFTPTRTVHALYAPPYTSALVIRSAPALEQIGQRWFTSFAGVIIIEAQKEVYAVRRDRKRVLARARALLPSGKPSMPVPANRDGRA
jgi:hypothetical protein